MKKILLLEDMEDRVGAFRAAITKLADFEMVLWRDAGAMIRDLPQTRVILPRLPCPRLCCRLRFCQT